MPWMDGCEVARRLRTEPGLANGVLAAVSGYPNEANRWKSQEAGFDHHLVNPICRTVVEGLVRSAAGA